MAAPTVAVDEDRSTDGSEQRPESGWARHWGWVTLLVLGAMLYWSRPTDLTIRGEETRRGRIAWEMLDRGDWLVPRLMSEPWCSRPPLHYWTIAATGVLRGQVDTLTVRMPSLIAVMLTSLLVYWYARGYLSRVGATAAGLAFLTFGQVLEIGRLGETEAVFTLLIASSLLLWHGLRHRGHSPWLYWSCGAVLAALATFAKGPQAPIYFWGGIGLYLLWTRNYREIFCRQAIAGFGLFMAIVLAWHIPFAQAAGWQYVEQIYFDEVDARFGDKSWGGFFEHLATYPLAIFFACLMPWSPLLLAFTNRKFWPHVRAFRDPIAFLVLAAGLAFIPVWLPQDSNPRYYMPMYPLIAVLIGLVVDRLFAAPRTEYWQELWPRYVATLSFVFGGLAVAAVVIAVARPLDDMSLPIPFALVYAAVLVVVADVLRRLRGEWQPRHASLALVLIASATGLTSVGFVTALLQSSSENAAATVAAIKRELPPDTELRGFGLVNHLFLFHHQQRIVKEPIPTDAATAADKGAYFCITVQHGRIPEMPFAWEPIGLVSCDRNKRPQPREEVLIGRITEEGSPAAVKSVQMVSELPPGVIR